MATEESRVEDVFFAAMEKTPDERAAFLDSVCGTDTALRERVLQLLEARSKMGEFLDTPPETATGPERVGDSVGPYRLLEILGEGGFGIVFLAEQEVPVRRRVALKVIKPGMDSREVVARFDAERQALALMDHPQIARVYDAGTTDRGRPYFVMELVEGLPITRFCDAKRLTVPERLKLFVQVCRAVEHAHQKGVIHRDLKPGNVLVALQDGQPVPKVIDFGVAKALNQKLTEQTLAPTGFFMLGTPLYMSPEQAEMGPSGIDTRSDVYSLGVLLYELLTGTTPIEHERLNRLTYDELRRVIREEEPPRPSARVRLSGESLAALCERRQTAPNRLRRALRGDLDAIVMKALEKDRARRYETVSALAADVNRHLNLERVLARPPSIFARPAKWCRRYRSQLMPLAIAAPLVVAFAAGLLWQERSRTLAALEQLRIQAEETERARARAERNFQDAQEAVDRMLTRAAEALDGEPRTERVRYALLTDALGYYTRFVEEREDDPEVRHELAHAVLRMAEIRTLMGDRPEAEAEFGRAIELFQALADTIPQNGDYRADLAQAWYRLATMYMNDIGGGKDKEAMEAHRRAYELREGLVAEFPTNVRYRSGLGASCTDMGVMLRRQGRLPEALEELMRGLAIRQELVKELPTDPYLRRDLAMAHRWLGYHLQFEGKIEESESQLLKSVELYGELVAEAGANASRQLRFDLANAIDDLGEMRVHSDRGPEGERDMLDAEKIFRALAAEFPDTFYYRRRLEDNIERLAKYYWFAGLWEQGHEYFQHMLRSREQFVADYPDNRDYRRRLLHILAMCPDPETRDPERAIELGPGCIAEAPGDKRPVVYLGIAHYRAGQWQRAVEVLTESVNLDPERVGEGYDKFFLAAAHWRLGNREQARRVFQEAQEWWDRIKTDDEVLHIYHDEITALIESEDPPQP
jgi:serine/threonine protein kinase